MSREIRRVPVGWQHPTEPNPHAEFQEALRQRTGNPRRRLVPYGMKFVPLFHDYPYYLASWETDLRNVKAREGHDWTFGVEYHLTGFKGRDDAEPAIHPFYVMDADDEIAVDVRDEDHLYELLVLQIEGQKPDFEDFMPNFDVAADDLGWCLYETVSEGTPTTPVFATAQELIDHLCAVGEDYDQKPYRREAAERLVTTGSSLGSMVVTGGVLYDSSRDADALDDALGSKS